jgi:hypothetical protein
MASFPVIDTDGHVLERQSDIRKYLGEPFVKGRRDCGPAISLGITT